MRFFEIFLGIASVVIGTHSLGYRSWHVVDARHHLAVEEAVILLASLHQEGKRGKLLGTGVEVDAKDVFAEYAADSLRAAVALSKGLGSVLFIAVPFVGVFGHCRTFAYTKRLICALASKCYALTTDSRRVVLRYAHDACRGAVATLMDFNAQRWTQAWPTLTSMPSP